MMRKTGETRVEGARNVDKITCSIDVDPGYLLEDRKEPEKEAQGTQGSYKKCRERMCTFRV